MKKLTEIAIAALASVVTAETVAKLSGKVAARLMARARKSDRWEDMKRANRYVRDVTTVLDKVYEDDTLTAEEEAELGKVLAAGLDPKVALNYLADKATGKGGASEASGTAEAGA